MHKLNSKYRRGGGYKRSFLLAATGLSVIGALSLAPGVLATGSDVTTDVTLEMPTAIKLSIDSGSQACGNDKTALCLKWSDDQSQATGAQSVAVETNDVNGYTLTYETVSGKNSTTKVADKLTLDGGDATIPFSCRLGASKDKACTVNATSPDTTTGTFPAKDNTHIFNYTVSDKPAYQLEAGNYTAYIRYTATAHDIDGGVSNPEEVAIDTCKSGDASNKCQVDYDGGMIPVRYAGDSKTAKWVKADPDKDWYDYSPEKKQWANAVTISDEAKLKEYQQAPAGTEVKNSDVAGYWVYIPRYAYEVKRYQASDHYIGEQNFSIHFEKATDTKSEPAPSCNPSPRNATVGDIWNLSEQPTSSDNKDENIKVGYYEQCSSISHDYGAINSSWATHPAFTFGSKELNGIWVAKFEMTGTRTAPTVKPNQSPNITETTGNHFTMAKSIGKVDSNNTGGSNIAGITMNSHHLAKYSSHLIKNKEWGAAAYLSASVYGAGVNNVRNNGAISGADGNTQDADGQNVYGSSGVATGCGPKSATDAGTYATGDKSLTKDKIESETACSTDGKHAYNQALGVLASTTNNVYGIYDMAAGSHEHVAASLTSDGVTGTSQNIGTPAKAPYIDLYSTTTDGFNTPTSWSIKDAYQYRYNVDNCTWASCGGQALYETRKKQAIFERTDSWGSDYFGICVL